MRLYWTRVVPKSNDWCVLIQKERDVRDSDADTEQGHMRVEAET